MFLGLGWSTFGGDDVEDPVLVGDGEVPVGVMLVGDDLSDDV